MKKIYLKEKEVYNIVRKIIQEQKTDYRQFLLNELKKVKSHYDALYKKDDTKRKFKNPSNVNKVLQYIPMIKMKVWNQQNSPSPKALGWVNQGVEYVVNLNLWKFKGQYKVYDTILHEAGHLLDFFMRKLGEDTITTSTTAYNNPVSQIDSYVANEAETFARIQSLRSKLKIEPADDTNTIMNKLVQAIKNKKMTFADYKISKKDNYLIFSKSLMEKGILSDLWKFFNVLKIDNIKIPDVSALFATFSTIKDGKVYLDVSKLASVNYATKGVQN